MIYTFLMKNKPMKIVPDTTKIPSSYFIPYIYNGLLTKYGNYVIEDIINFILEKSGNNSLSFQWNNKTLSSIPLKREDIINPKMHKATFTFELKKEKYGELRAHNRGFNKSSLNYYDLNDPAKETEKFEINLANILANSLKDNNQSIGIRYNKNHFFETKQEDPNSQYIFIEVPMFNKKYGIEAFHNNIYQDEETTFVATAFAVFSSVKNQTTKKIDFLYADNPSRKYENYREISTNENLSTDYVGLFKYNDQYLKIQSSDLHNKGTIFTVDTKKNSYGFLNDSTYQYINGIDFLNYIRHNISRSYSIYECIGVGEQKQIGFPRSYNIIKDLSTLSEENLYLIPSPVYNQGTHAIDEKNYDNSELMFPDSFSNITMYHKAEEIMKYHHNRSFFFIEAGIDIYSDRKQQISNFHYKDPYVGLSKDNQLTLHYGKSDWLTIDGKKTAFFRKLPFKLGNIDEAKEHAKKVYSKISQTKTVSPWKIDTFDKFKKSIELIESWQDNFISPSNYHDIINDFIDLSMLADKKELFLVPIEKDKEVSEENIIEHAINHINFGHAWYCKIDEVLESDIDSISMPICEVLDKIAKYSDYEYNSEKGIIYGISETSNYRHSIKYPIFSVLNKEELEKLRLAIYNKWISNDYKKIY